MQTDRGWFLSAGAAASAWALVLNNLEGDSARTAFTLLVLVAVGGGGYPIGRYLAAKFADGELAARVKNSITQKLLVVVISLPVFTYIGSQDGWPWGVGGFLLITPGLIWALTHPDLSQQEIEFRKRRARIVGALTFGVSLAAVVVGSQIDEHWREAAERGLVLGLVFAFVTAVAGFIPLRSRPEGPK